MKLSKTLYYQRKEQGLCTKCGKIAYKNQTLCVDCKEKAKRRNDEYKQRLSKSGELKRRRESRKQNGICLQCGGNAIVGKVLCEVCNEKNNQRRNEDRKYYRDNKICPNCTLNKLLGDEKNCLECRAKNAEKKAKYRRENKEEYNQYQRDYGKRRYKQLQEAGICTRCQKRSSDNGMSTCSICRAKINAYRQSKKNSIPRCERNSYGLCYFCGKKLDRDGKSCVECSKRNIENLSNSSGSGAWRESNNKFFIKVRGVTNGQTVESM